MGLPSREAMLESLIFVCKSIIFSCGEGSGVNVVLDTVDPETYTNEVFDEEDMANNDSAKSPQPFIFPSSF
jgi:hypothetical protein